MESFEEFFFLSNNLVYLFPIFKLFSNLFLILWIFRLDFFGVLVHNISVASY
jgi:hypothetical protein